MEEDPLFMYQKKDLEYCSHCQIKLFTFVFVVRVSQFFITIRGIKLVEVERNIATWWVIVFASHSHSVSKDTKRLQAPIGSEEVKELGDLEDFNIDTLYFHSEKLIPKSEINIIQGIKLHKNCYFTLYYYYYIYKIK